MEQERAMNSWEEAQLIASGVAFPNRVATEFEDESAEAVELQVIETKPPFLDPNIKYTEQKDPVSVVKDPTSDIAVAARQGSKLVQRIRLEHERQQFGSKPWKIDSNSMLGIIVGAQPEQESLYFYCSF